MQRVSRITYYGWPAAVRYRAPVAAAAVPWWLSGGILVASCVAAYQPKGAADYAASLVNLNNPGTNDASVRTGAPTFDTTKGWVGKAGCSGMQVTGYVTAGGVYSVALRVVGIPDWQFPVDTTGGAGGQQLGMRATASPSHGYYVGGVTSPASATGNTGVFIVVSQNGTDQETGYMNGVQEQTNWTVNPVGNGTTFICGPNTAVTYSIAAVAWYAVRLSAVQVLALATAMAAL